MGKKNKTVEAPGPRWDAAWGSRSCYQIVGFSADGERVVEFPGCYSPKDMRSFADWLTGRIVYSETGRGGLIARTEIEIYRPGSWDVLP